MAMAIVTRYVGPTNTRGSKMTAFYLDNGKRRSGVSLPYDAFTSDRAARVAAVRLLCAQLGWEARWVAADLGGDIVFSRTDGWVVITSKTAHDALSYEDSTGAPD